MRSSTRLIQNTLVSEGVASAIGAAVLSLLAKAEGAAPVQPINATSHWLHGETAGNVKGIDAKHTVPGLATHCGACVFWAALFETLRAASPRSGTGRIIRDAAAVSAVAAAVDYGLVPKNLTPGWEGPLPLRSVAGGFAGLALGLAIGGLVTGARR